MIKLLKRLLGIELIEYHLEEFSQDDVKLSRRVREVEKDMRDLLVYLNVERKEEWQESKNPLDTPKLVKSNWVKKNAKNTKKSSRRVK